MLVYVCLWVREEATRAVWDANKSLEGPKADGVGPQNGNLEGHPWPKCKWWLNKCKIPQKCMKIDSKSRLKMQMCATCHHSHHSWFSEDVHNETLTFEVDIAVKTEKWGTPENIQTQNYRNEHETVSGGGQKRTPKGSQKRLHSNSVNKNEFNFHSENRIKTRNATSSLWDRPSILRRPVQGPGKGVGGCVNLSPVLNNEGFQKIEGILDLHFRPHSAKGW